MSDTEPVVQEKKRGRAAAVKANADKPAPVEEVKEPKKRGRAAAAAAAAAVTTPAASPATTVKESKKDNTESCITVEDNDEPANKRGRGRPPKGVANKITTNKKKGKAISGKKSGRGRPKKDETEDNKSDENEEDGDGEE